MQELIVETAAAAAVCVWLCVGCEGEEPFSKRFCGCEWSEVVTHLWWNQQLSVAGYHQDKAILGLCRHGWEQRMKKKLFFLAFYFDAGSAGLE